MSHFAYSALGKQNGHFVTYHATVTMLTGHFMHHFDRCLSYSAVWSYFSSISITCSGPVSCFILVSVTVSTCRFMCQSLSVHPTSLVLSTAVLCLIPLHFILAVTCLLIEPTAASVCCSEQLQWRGTQYNETRNYLLKRLAELRKKNKIYGFTMSITKKDGARMLQESCYLLGLSLAGWQCSVHTSKYKCRQNSADLYPPLGYR
jgi:hypothetical protein